MGDKKPKNPKPKTIKPGPIKKIKKGEILRRSEDGENIVRR